MLWLCEKIQCLINTGNIVEHWVRMSGCRQGKHTTECRGPAQDLGVRVREVEQGIDVALGCPSWEH